MGRDGGRVAGWLEVLPLGQQGRVPQVLQCLPVSVIPRNCLTLRQLDCGLCCVIWICRDWCLGQCSDTGGLRIRGLAPRAPDPQAGWVLAVPMQLPRLSCLPSFSSGFTKADNSHLEGYKGTGG